MNRNYISRILLAGVCFAVAMPSSILAEERLERQRNFTPEFPPKLPGDQRLVTDSDAALLTPPKELRDGVRIATTPPRIDFLYYPGQTYEGKPWSNWGDSLFTGGKYYASIGDHLAPRGHAFVFEYDPQTKKLRQIADVTKTLNLAEGHYTPGKIHGRLDMGRDGWLYYSTHRGSKRVTTDEHHYKGDWIFRTQPATGKTEIVTMSPIPRHSIPNTVLDPQRMIFYGGTASGMNAATEEIRFFGYDLVNKKLVTDITNGPARSIMLANDGTVFFTPKNDLSPLMFFHPSSDRQPQKVAGELGNRACTQETPDGVIYTVSQAPRGQNSSIYAFRPKTGAIEKLGTAAVGSENYVATIDADPSGRYLYYVPGAHGGADRDGSPLVQFDTRTKTKKVIAFLDPYYRDKYRVILAGTYSVAVDDKGETVYVTWNAGRGSRAWDCCALTAIHIPVSERPLD